MWASCTFCYDGTGKTETAILQFDGCGSVGHTLHELGLDLCADAKWANRCRHNHGLTIGMLLNGATPEMFAKYDVTLISLPGASHLKPDGCDIQIDSTDIIVTPEELKTMEVTQANMQTAFCKIFSLMKAHREFHHPVISTWDDSRICRHCASWARSFVASRQTDVESFFREQLKYAMPSEPPFELSPLDIA